MNTKIIHCVILLLLLSLTVHEVHASVIHDVETCDVCIHIQSNNDGLADNGPHYVLLDMAFHLKIKAPSQQFSQTTATHTDYIRGPPVFS